LPREAIALVLLMTGCVAPAAPITDEAKPVGVPVDLPINHYRCDSNDDCAIAGDACHSCGSLTVINRKYLPDFNEKYGKRGGVQTVACEACDTSQVELGCEHGMCREAQLQIDAVEYRVCTAVSDCTIGLDPCAQPVALNRYSASQYRALSHVTPQHCRRMPERVPVGVACASSRCEVLYESSDQPQSRSFSQQEIESLGKWDPYIRHGHGKPGSRAAPEQQDPQIVPSRRGGG